MQVVIASQAADAEVANVVSDPDPAEAAARFDKPDVIRDAEVAFDPEPCAIAFRGIVIGLLIALPFWIFVGWGIYRLL